MHRRCSRSIVPIFLVSVCVLSLASCEPVQPDPRALLEQLKSASLETPIVQYRFAFQETRDEGPGGQAEGSVVLQRLDLSGAGFSARVEADRSLADGSRERVLVVRDRDELAALDEASQVVRRSSLYVGGASLMSPVQDVLMYTFFDPNSLADEIGAEQVSYLGQRTVHGESCHEVKVEYADDEEHSVWCLGLDDHLPRSLSWIGAHDRTRLEIFKMSTTISPPAADLTIPTPTGF